MLDRLKTWLRTSDWSIALFLGLTFFLLSWRLFALGSEHQLFLYNDALQYVNAISQYVQEFSWRHPFDTFVSRNGMMGSYTMAEPQTSLFFAPITLIVILAKFFSLGGVGIYYLVLLMISAHMVAGAFAVYLILKKIFSVERMVALIGGVVFLGLGWNVAWMGAGYLAMMVGWVPLLLLALLLYLRKPSVRSFAWYLAAFTFFLYAGGLVNFFFYIWINGFILFLAAIWFDIPTIHSIKGTSRLVRVGSLAFVVVPLLALGMYAVQLMLTLSVTKDISHASTSFDYLAFFGLRFSDIVGLLLPRFGLLDFGSMAEARIVFNEGGRELYGGIIPLALTAIAALYIRRKDVLLLVGLAGLNFLLAFGGQTALYQLSWLFPANDMFRGHYKYLLLVGIYLSLLVPLVLHSLKEKPLEGEQVRAVLGAGNRLGWVLAGSTVLCVLGSFAWVTIPASVNPLAPQYLEIARTLANYLGRATVFTAAATLLLRYLLTRTPRPWLYALIGIMIVLDASVNYVYAQHMRMPITDVVNTGLFASLRNERVFNDLDQLSQLYVLPSTMKVDVSQTYSAIPNTYLTDYNSLIGTSANAARLPLLQAAGISKVLTTESVQRPEVALLEQSPIGDRYKQLYMYRGNGSVREDAGAISQYAQEWWRIYKVANAHKVRVSTRFRSVETAEAMKAAIADDGFSAEYPVLQAATLNSRAEGMVSVQTETDEPTHKSYTIDSDGTAVVVIATPYAGIWQATLNGKAVPILRANYAFMAVEVPTAGRSTLQVRVATRPYWLGAGLSIGTWISTLAVLAWIAKRHAYLVPKNEASMDFDK